MTDGDAQAYPLMDGVDNEVQTGLTKREYFAAMALQGLCARTGSGLDATDLGGISTALADNLIDALNTD